MTLKRLYIGMVVVPVLVHLVGWGALSGDAQLWAVDVSGIVYPLGVAALAWRTRDNRRMMRILLTLGLLWGLANAVWAVHELVLETSPFPSLADVGYLLACFAFIALLANWPGLEKKRPARSWVMPALAVAVAFIVTFEFFLVPILGAGIRSGADALAALYPLADQLALSLACGLLVLERARERGRLVLFAAGLFLFLLADSAFAQLDLIGHWPGDAVALGWPLAFLVWGLAIAVPTGWADDTIGRVSEAAAGVFLACLLAVAITHSTLAGDFTPAELASSLLSGLLLIAVVAHMWFVARIDRAASARELGARARFAAEIVNAQEYETRRIAELLHDDAVQRLTALALRLELASLRSGDDDLSAHARDANDITSSLRTLLVQLHPAVLESQGLGPAIEAATQQLRSKGVVVTVAPFAGRHAPETEQLLYRLVLEAVANTAKHANASRVHIAIECSDDVLRCRVEDNGIGFDLDAVTNGIGTGQLGLHLLRERVLLGHGSARLESRPGEGTTLHIELPATGRTLEPA